VSSKVEKNIEEHISNEDINNVRSWINNNKEIIPCNIFSIIVTFLNVYISIFEILDKNKKIVETLRRVMGFTASRENNGKEKIDNSEQPKCDNNEQDNNLKYSPEIEDKLKNKYNIALAKLREYQKSKPKKQRKKKKNSNIEPEIKSAENLDNQITDSNIENLDDQILDSNEELSGSREPVFCNDAVEYAQKEVEKKVDANNIPPNLVSKSSSYQDRTRYEISLTVTEITYHVETVSDPITGFSTSAKVEDGPAKYQITWSGIVQLVMLVIGMALPLNRLSNCLKTKISYFSPSRIYSMLKYTAHALFAIYIQLYKELAAEADIINTDDTNTSVLGMRKDMEELSKEELDKIKEMLEISKNEPDPQKIKILLEAEEYLPGQCKAKNSDNLKKQIFTTVLYGQRLKLKQSGNIVFYYTERKSAGDLLGNMLKIREKVDREKQEKDPNYQKSMLIIQSDSSSQNIPNPLPYDVVIIYIGCGSHARRPFWRYRNDCDYGIKYHCITMLYLFEQLFDAEKAGKATNSKSKLIENRNTIQKGLWEQIKKQAEQILQEYAQNSPIGVAAKYIINNYEVLTNYFNHPNVSIDNNISERMVRFEAIMMSSSKFRVSRLGRLTFDIIRTILSTCASIGLNSSTYLLYILKNQIEVRKDPKNHTPYAYMMRMKNKETQSK